MLCHTVQVQFACFRRDPIRSDLIQDGKCHSFKLVVDGMNQWQSGQATIGF